MTVFSRFLSQVSILGDVLAEDRGSPEYYDTGTVFRLFVWNCRNCPGNLVFIFRVKMDDALV